MTVLQVRHKPKKESRVYIEANQEKSFKEIKKQGNIFGFRRIKNV